MAAAVVAAADGQAITFSESEADLATSTDRISSLVLSWLNS
jgi:hypothetical protein